MRLIPKSHDCLCWNKVKFVFNPGDKVVAEIRKRGVASRNPFGVIVDATREGAPTGNDGNSSPQLRPPPTLDRTIVIKYFCTEKCEVYGALSCHARWIGRSRYELRLWRRVPSEISLYHIDWILRYVVGACTRIRAPSVEIKVVSDYDRKLLVPRLLKFGFERRDVSWWGNLTQPESRPRASSNASGGDFLMSVAGIASLGVLGASGEDEAEGEGEECDSSGNDGGLYALEFGQKDQKKPEEPVIPPHICENGHPMTAFPVNRDLAARQPGGSGGGGAFAAVRCDVCCRTLQKIAATSEDKVFCCHPCRYSCCDSCRSMTFDESFGRLSDTLADKVLVLLGAPVHPETHYLDLVCTKFRAWCEMRRRLTYELREDTRMFEVPILHANGTTSYTISQRRVLEYGGSFHKLRNLRRMTRTTKEYTLPLVLSHPHRKTIKTLSAHVDYSAIFSICQELPSLTQLGLLFDPYANWELEGREFSPNMWRNLQVLQLRPEITIEGDKELTFFEAIPWEWMPQLRTLVLHITAPTFPQNCVLPQLEELYVHRVPPNDDSWALTCANVTRFGVRDISERHRKLLLKRKILTQLKTLYWDPPDRFNPQNRKWKAEMRKRGFFVQNQMPKIYTEFYAQARA